MCRCWPSGERTIRPLSTRTLAASQPSVWLTTRGSCRGERERSLTSVISMANLRCCRFLIGRQFFVSSSTPLVLALCVTSFCVRRCLWCSFSR